MEFRRVLFRSGGDERGGMDTPRARDDLVLAVLRRRPHQQRLDDAALADGREYVADLRGLAAVPPVGPADRQPVLRYADPKSRVYGRGGSVRVHHGCCRTIHKKTTPKKRI